jgi:hypothetical protein
MKAVRVALVLLTLFLALGVASVYANDNEGNLSDPILGTTGVPALAAPSLFSGAISVLYADGTPVVLSTNRMYLNLCTSSNSNATYTTTTTTMTTNNNSTLTTGCASVLTTLKQTSPGTYTYTFTPPSLIGTVTIYVVAGSLADDNGKIFPSVDTQIGTYAYAPSVATGTSAPIGTANTPPPAGTPPGPLTGQAVNTIQTPTQPFPIGILLAVLSVFALAGCLLILPSRH